MKKSMQWLGVFAMGIVSAAALAGCSSQDPATSGTAGTGTTGGTGTGGTAATGGATTTGGTGAGVQLTGPAAYTVLTGADAMAGATPAPSAWVDKGCATCHGPNGEGVSLGTTPFGPELRHVPTTYGTWVVRHGRPSPSPMVEFPEVPTMGKTDITAADLTSILTWLQGQPKPTTGEGLYKDFCGNCHGPKMGTGGVVPVSIVGKKMSEITQKVRMGEGTDPSMRNGYMPIEDMTALTDAELALIGTFLGATP